MSGPLTGLIEMLKQQDFNLSITYSAQKQRIASYHPFGSDLQHFGKCRTKVQVNNGSVRVEREQLCGINQMGVHKLIDSGMINWFTMYQVGR